VAKFFIDRPVFAIVLSILITLGGLMAIINLPIAQYPQISPPRVTVSTSYNGANAETVEASVAQIIDQQVNGVERMIAMQSTSSNNGRYSLDIKFELGQNPDMAAVQAQNRAAQANAQLPEEVKTSGVTTKKVSPDTVMYFSLWSPNGTYDQVFLKNYGSVNIVEELRRVKGIGDVTEYGTDLSMRIWLQPDKMSRLGITAADVSTAIQRQNLEAPAGGIGQQPAAPNQQFEYTASVKGRLSTPAEFENVIVRSQADGSFVHLKDVARVELGGRDYQFTSDTNGNPSVTFAIQLTTDANALETATAAQKIIDNAALRFPTDMQFKILVDNTRFVRASLKEVMKTFAEAIVLVLIIVFLFLQNWRATLIPMLAIPVSLVGTFAAFLVLGFSINTLTLFAMVLAIGLVVDDAIVVVENVEHHMRYNGLNPKEATYRAMEEVSGPVVAIAFVLSAVFIPVAFFGGSVGVLYKQFALTISISMLLSALVALTLTPALCAMILQPHDPHAHSGIVGRFFHRFNIWFERTTARYSEGVKLAIRRTGLSLAMLAVIVILAGVMYRILPSSFVPSEDQGFFLTTVTLPEASSSMRTRQVANEIAKELRGMSGVTDTMVITGYDILSGAPKPNAALMITALKPWAERTSKELHVEQRIRQAFAVTSRFPEAVSMSFNIPTLPGLSAIGGMTIILQDRSGSTVQEMDAVAKQFVAAAQKRPEIGRVYTTFNTNTPGYRFDIDREKAEKIGVPVKDIFTTLQAFLGGQQVNDFNLFGRNFKVVMQADSQFRSDVEAMRFFYVRSSTGAMVPLNALVKPVSINGPTAIKRFNGYRAVQIGASPAPGYSTGQAMTALEQVAAEALPKTFSYEWADQSREEKISAGRAPVIFGLSLVFVFLCLAALYESWRIPFAVILSIPTAVLGCLLFQYVRGLENNVYMQIGLVMLIGLAAKNAILIVEFAKVRVDMGMDPYPAVVEAAKLRLRPILMTSLAFIIGCLPLMIATGAGAGARVAMGTAVVGGMLVATILGIFVVPVLFVAIERYTHRKAGTKQPINMG
jgi:hydrophobe/amphiphile efflux-1 (HAE1) family protein